MHGLGISEAVAGSVPDPLVPALTALTQLGDAWFLATVAALAYWIAPDRVVPDRRNGARLLAVTLAGMAAVTTLKVVVGHPRPPIALVEPDGYSLPSGHATGSAATYVGAALLSTWRSRRERIALAAALVAVVSATRVALGVHYALDVVAGVALGSAVAVGVVALTRTAVGPGFYAAAVAAVGGVVAAPTAEDPLAMAGVAVGAALAWAVVKKRSASLTRPSRGLLVAGVVVVGGFAVVALKLASMPALVALSGFGAGAGVVALPAVQNFSR